LGKHKGKQKMISEKTKSVLFVRNCSMIFMIFWVSWTLLFTFGLTMAYQDCSENVKCKESINDGIFITDKNYNMWLYTFSICCTLPLLMTCFLGSILWKDKSDLKEKK